MPEGLLAGLTVVECGLESVARAGRVLADLGADVRRRARVDDVERVVAEWTRSRSRLDVAETLQAVGIEAVPVADFGDVRSDPHVIERDHFVALEHPVHGARSLRAQRVPAERRVQRLDRSCPTLGQDNDWVLRDVLGLTDSEVTALEEAGAVE